MNTATVTIRTREEEAREQMEQERALALLPDTAVQLHQDVEQMGALLKRMGQVIGAMQRRMDDLEARQASVTISHAEVKRLQGMIRVRSDELCRMYRLQDDQSPKVFRAAIKKDLLKRYQVKDLHDVPAAGLAGAEHTISNWVNIRLAMERREII